MNALHGTVRNVKKIRTQQVAVVEVEIPADYYKQAVAFADDQNVLVTLSDLNIPFGVFDSESVPEAGREAVESAPVVVRPGAKKGPFGKHYSKLVQNGYFYRPQVAEAVGTDAEFLEWIRRQPSAFSGQFSELVEELGELRCVAAHVRRSSNGGIAIKPAYSAIPLTHTEHNQQHQEGESSLFPVEQWEKKAAKYLGDWVRVRLRMEFKTTSLSFIPPETFRAWAEAMGVDSYLPNGWGQ